MSSFSIKKLDILVPLYYNHYMKTAQVIASSLERLPKGRVFTYANFVSNPNQKEAIIKTLNRMAAAGKIAKLAKGRYYKPEESTFGKLQPSQNEIVKDLLEKDGKVTGYLTGYSIYNQLSLTTQVSNIIQIGRNDVRPTFNRARYTISFIRQKNIITKENIPLLQILDVVRSLKRIPDTNPALAYKRLLAIIRDLSRKEKKSLVELALKYPPSTRAFLGAALNELGDKPLTKPLRESLNPISVYKLPAAITLKSAEEWNIK
jgi:hypothetical protein